MPTTALLGNRLLHRIPAAERRSVEARARDVELPFGTVLCEAGKRIRHVYFPHRGVISLSASSGDGPVVHVAHVSEEGMFGLPLATGEPTSPLHAVAHGDGSAARIDSHAFVVLLAECPALRHALLVYAHALMTQIAQSVICNTLHPVQARLARWLLSTADRLRTDSLWSKQETIAEVLGVLRPAVSKAASELHRLGLIEYARGSITIVDRAGLEEEACSCYGIIRKVVRSALH